MKVLILLSIVLIASVSSTKFLEKGQELPAVFEVISKSLSYFWNNNSNSSDFNRSNSTWNHTRPSKPFKANQNYFRPNGSNVTNDTRYYTIFNKTQNTYFEYYFNNGSNGSNVTNTTTVILTTNFISTNIHYQLNSSFSDSWFWQNFSTYTSNWTYNGTTYINVYNDYAYNITHFIQGIIPINSSYSSNYTYNVSRVGSTVFNTTYLNYLRISTNINATNSSNWTDPYNNNTNWTDPYNNYTNYTNWTDPYYNYTNYTNWTDPYYNYTNWTDPYYNYTNWTDPYYNYTKRSDPYRNSSNVTNSSVVVETFNEITNDYFRRFYNYTRIPCDYVGKPYCINATSRTWNYTWSNTEWRNGSVVTNITHNNVANNYLDVYYNSWYGLPFDDIIFLNSTNNTYYNYYYVSGQ